MWMNFGQTTTKVNGRVVEKHPNEVWLKYSYDESEEWSKIFLLKEDENATKCECISAMHVSFYIYEILFLFSYSMRRN